MQQKNYFRDAKERKFEHGVLRADSCCERYSLPRRYQYRNRFEDLVQYSFGRTIISGLLFQGLLFQVATALMGWYNIKYLNR